MKKRCLEIDTLKRLIVMLCFSTILVGWKEEPLPTLSGDNSKIPTVASGKDPKGPKEPQYAPGEVLVKFKSNVSASWPTLEAEKAGVARESARAGVRAEHKKSFSSIKVHLIKITDKGMTVEEAVARLRSNPNVEYAEPNYTYQIDSIPDDPRFNELWGLHNTGQTGGTNDADIDAPEAWDIQPGSSDHVIGVIDTGVDYTHEDLADNMWINPGEIPGDGIDNDGNGYIDDVYGINAITSNGDPMDDHNHGTHVAGTIGAIGNNSKGIIGLNPSVKIMALKFLNASGSGYNSDAIECIEYIITMKNRGVNIKATNNSWGGGSFSQALYDAIKSLRDNDILFVAAAGNDDSDNDITPHYPSSYNLENIISVAATDHNDRLAYFSNYGETSVDVAAPGVKILSTLPGGNSYSPQPGDAFFDDIESGNVNWTPNAPWAITSEQNHTSYGLYSWTDSPNSNYSNNRNISLTSRTIDLSSLTGDVRLGFWIKGRLESNYDYLYIEISSDNGASWTRAGKITGSIADWQLKTYTMSSSYRTANFKFRFRLYTDSSVTYDGVYIDDVGIGIGSGSNNYGSFSGTSMATPHVTGLASLISAQNPGFTYSQTKNAILNSVDVKSSLNRRILTGGRINARNAFLPVAPGSLSASTESSSKIYISWMDRSPDETCFKIWRSSETDNTWVLIAAVGANEINFYDTGLDEATAYYYRVSAFNAAGDSAYSNEANATTFPSAPVSLSAAVISSSQINILWKDTSRGESGFNIERKIGMNGAWNQIDSVGANIMSYSDTGLNEATTYYYRVRAFNTAGNSLYSNEIYATTSSPQLGGCGCRTVSISPAYDTLNILLPYLGPLTILLIRRFKRRT